jgi:hypothetical protein
MPATMLPRKEWSKKVTTGKILRAVERDDSTGFCLACGAEQGGCEPDARGYKCDGCDEMQVYGAEELMFVVIG